MPRLILLAIVVSAVVFAGCVKTEHPGPLRVRVESIAYSSPTNLTLIIAFENTGTQNITRADFDISEFACRFKEGSNDCEGGYTRFPATFNYDDYDQRAVLNDTDVIPPGATWLATVGIDYGPAVLSRTGYYYISTYGQYRHGTEEWKGRFQFPCYDGDLTPRKIFDSCDTSM